MRENSRRRNDKSPAVRNIVPELYPRGMMFYNNIPEYLIRELLDEALFIQVHPWIRRFNDTVIDTIKSLNASGIPEYVSACKKRSALLTDFCQQVVALVEQGYHPYLVGKDNLIKESDYDLPFVKEVLGYNPDTDQMFSVHVNMTNHPQAYRYLYRVMLMGVQYGNITQLATLAVIVQSWSEGIWEAISFTDDEIIEAEKEFLASSTKEPTYSREGELGSLLEQVSKDMKSSQPKKYVEDLRNLRRYHDGYIYGTQWSLNDGWYSLKSSGSRLSGYGNIPNCGILFSLIESDYSDPGDEIIGYRSFYPNEPIEGLTMFDSLTMSVPKTSSRGRRFIHPQSNPKQDRGNYFQRMEEHSLRDIVASDCTYFQWLGQDATKAWTDRSIENQGFTLICSDIHHATDETEHEFLLQCWDILYMPGISEYLLRLHSGRGQMEVHYKTRDGLKTRIIDYDQRSGIRCGTNSNFAVCLDLPHHLVVRATMLKMGWEDMNPLDLYRLVGDDLTLHLPTNKWEEFFTIYHRLMNEAGMHVHPLNEKGMISHSDDIMFRAEFCKQTFVNGGILSRIPHRLFFQEDTPEARFAVFIWLAKYNRLCITPEMMLRVFQEQPWSAEKLYDAVTIWNYFVDHEMFGLSKKDMPNLRIGEVSISEDREYRLARTMFLQVYEDSVFDAVIDSHGRLDDEAKESKLKKFFNLADRPEVVEVFLKHYHDHTPDGMLGKYEMTELKNQQLHDAVKSLSDSKLIDIASSLGLFSDEERELIRQCVTIVTTFPEDFGAPDGAAEKLIKCEQIFKSVQPHAVAKSTKRFSSTFFKILNRYCTG